MIHKGIWSGLDVEVSRFLSRLLSVLKTDDVNFVQNLKAELPDLGRNDFQVKFQFGLHQHLQCL